ncbi:MAG: hypothetical protein OEY14_13840, partial [Myxococcales bacterium]|nr:hypothetical protein [Myxococcales bacterium]
VRGCDSNTCPDEAVCVLWRGDVDRTSQTWCMAACESDGDCRDDEGYRCVGVDDPRVVEGMIGPPMVVDRSGSAKFCVTIP